MDNKKLETYRNGLEIKPVSKLPNWLLLLLGKIDSKKGEGVANAHIMNFLDKCTEYETLECLYAEDLLHETRKQGADALSTIKDGNEKLLNKKELLPENGPKEIRENARRLFEVSEAEKAIAAAKRSLFTIDEIITNGNTILHERIIKTRKKASGSIDTYIKGIRSGKLKDFEFDVNFSQKAIDDYHNRHMKSDEAINHYATAYLKGENDESI